MVCNLSSLNFHHSSLKILQFPKPPIWHLNSDPVFNFKSYGWVSQLKKKFKEFVKHCGWVCRFNYENAIENWVLEIENTSNVFSVFITHHSKIRELSDGNNDSKLIQTNAHSWDPYDLDDRNRKLSDITQNSSYPNNFWTTLSNGPHFSFSKLKILRYEIRNTN